MLSFLIHTESNCEWNSLRKGHKALKQGILDLWDRTSYNPVAKIQPYKLMYTWDPCLLHPANEVLTQFAHLLSLIITVSAALWLWSCHWARGYGSRVRRATGWLQFWTFSRSWCICGKAVKAIEGRQENSNKQFKKGEKSCLEKWAGCDVTLPSVWHKMRTIEVPWQCSTEHGEQQASPALRTHCFCAGGQHWHTSLLPVTLCFLHAAGACESCQRSRVRARNLVFHYS